MAILMMKMLGSQEFEGKSFSENPIWKLEHFHNSQMYRMMPYTTRSLGVQEPNPFRIFESESSCERRVLKMAACFAPAIQQ